MVELSNYIEYPSVELPEIPDHLLFKTIDEIRDNCEVIYDAYMYKTYQAPQELYDFMRPLQGKPKVHDNFSDIMRMYVADVLQIRYQVMTEQLPIHMDADSRGITHVLNYHIDTGGDDVKTRWWDMPDDLHLRFDGGPFDYHMGDYYDQSKIVYETVIPKDTWHFLRVNYPHDIGRISRPRLGLRMWNSWIGQA